MLKRGVASIDVPLCVHCGMYTVGYVQGVKVIL